MADTSRDPADLHLYLQEAWDYLRAQWERENPDGLYVALSATYRGPEDQQEAYESNLGPPYGQSFHNFHPAYAFDVFFHDGQSADWSFQNFQRFGEMAEAIGLEWGGRWRSLVDGPHIQLGGMTLKDAAAGIVRNKPEIPGAPLAEPEENWLIVVMDGSEVLTAVEVPPDHAIFTRVSSSRRRFYVDVRPDSV